VNAALRRAQVLPASCGAVLAVPTGVLLLVAANHTGHVDYPPLWQTLLLVIASVLVTAALTALPARRAAAVSSVWASSP
jgi:putative ABC transport system permease protein